LKILQIDTNFVKNEYLIYRQQSLVSIPKTISDAIEVDVNRSFNSLKVITSENLNNILKSYAIVNQHSLDYCQGMNFIAGFLFLVFEQSEALAFAVMKAVIAKFRMHELFNTELPMLKLNFYQLDRLIAILLPDLHRHFKVRTLISNHILCIGRANKLELLQFALLYHPFHQCLADADLG
jgi:Rab-GTPase-TBC domain